ncbi:nuclease-related domain-containing protein [Cytobacillus massiliigabonensis]|uniref:nuclease-related domain-containing protein n=1 Tax=Cytobacillus massiliigabonensis TaxID=1871011 RepID=UPI000C81EEEF|nr:nuclease-related domain-containing protein [Cytobacillus massiliigabonensis]
MIYKPRMESIELLILKALDSRICLSSKVKQLYFNLKKGYEGEILFDSLTEQLQCECLILNDLLLKQNNTLFQIDSLIIMSDTIYLFEVKNYEGNYYYESDKLYKIPKSEINNPLIQLIRSESLLRQFLHSLGITIPIHSSIVYINPEFTLYQTPLDKPFILPTQVNSFLKKLNKSSTKLNEKHNRMADKLILHHIQDPPFNQLPSYKYEEMHKGITCVNCTSITVSNMGKICICHKCGFEEAVEAAVMRSVEEYKLLFPEKKVTTNIIHEWCKVVKSKKRIRRILSENFKIMGVRQWTYYE